MRLCHTRAAVAASFDDPNLVSAAGLVPVMRLAATAGLAELADERLSVPTDKGANAGAKVASLVAGMVAGADSIDDMALLRHGAMARLFTAPYAPSTLGSFLRSFTFGHVRQLDAVASRFLGGLAAASPLLGGAEEGSEEMVLVDLDDTIIEVHGYAKHGSAYGYSKVRGLNALIATVSTARTAPVIVAQRLRKGPAGHRAAPNASSPMPWPPWPPWPGCAQVNPAAKPGRCCCGPIRRSTGAPRSERRPAPVPRSRSRCA